MLDVEQKPRSVINAVGEVVEIERAAFGLKAFHLTLDLGGGKVLTLRFPWDGPLSDIPVRFGTKYALTLTEIQA